jgi:hypothetical protein
MPKKDKDKINKNKRRNRHNQLPSCIPNLEYIGLNDTGDHIYQLLNDMHYEDIIVPKGFKTDLASIPRFYWHVLTPVDIADAGIVHDFLVLKISTVNDKIKANYILYKMIKSKITTFNFYVIQFTINSILTYEQLTSYCSCIKTPKLIFGDVNNEQFVNNAKQTREQSKFFLNTPLKRYPTYCSL